MKQLCILFLVLVVSLKLSAQEISSSQLVGTKWENVDSKKSGTQRENSISFGSTTIDSESYYPKIDMSIKKHFYYYLSDYIPESFDSTLVGKETKGIYLITFEKKLKGMGYAEIYSLDLEKGEFYLLHRTRPGVIGGRDITTHYKLISKSEETLEANQETEPEAESSDYTQSR